MSATTSCPYCNAVVPMTAEQLAVPQRVSCPRCGEAVPIARPAELNGFAPAGAVLAPAAPSSVSRRGGNRLVGFAVLGLMLLLALALTIVLINTRGKRRLVMLAESPALGYLPADTNVIIKINMEEAERSKEARDALDRLGFGTGGTFDLERLVGIRRDQIEEAILGLRVDSNLVPRLRFVVRTSDDIDPERLKQRLNVKGSKKDGTREYDLIQPPGLPLELALWLPTSRTVIAVYPPEELDKVPDDPKQPVERFAAPLVDLLKSRPERDTFFSIVAHSDDWNKTAMPLVLGKLKFDDRKMLLNVRSFGVGLRKDSGATITRARPARIVTETPDEDPQTIAADVAFTVAPNADATEIIGAFQQWAEAQKLVEREGQTSGLRHSVILVGKPEDWERVLGSLRGVLR